MPITALARDITVNEIITLLFNVLIILRENLAAQVSLALDQFNFILLSRASLFSISRIKTHIGARMRMIYDNSRVDRIKMACSHRKFSRWCSLSGLIKFIPISKMPCGNMYDASQLRGYIPIY